MPESDNNGDIAYTLGHPPQPHFAPSKWAFDSRVTDQFDDMLRRSIPDYTAMRRVCFDVGTAYVQRGTDILDLGCSRGEAVAPFVEYFGAQNRYVLCETSEPMRRATAERFHGWLNTENYAPIMRLEDCDITERLPPALFGISSLTLCVLTLMFTRPETRLETLRRVYERTTAGGALLLVEKVTSPHERIDGHLTRTYHAMKRENGYTAEEIAEKAQALEGVLIPFSAGENEDLLKRAGFTQIECVWRWINFAAWVAVKD